MTETCPIILCGFTSSGKTTIGKLLSEKLNLPFFDTDQMLIEHYQMTIPEIFSKGGETLFRDYEHEIARQVCTLGPSVVSTGGGMLTFDRNGEILAKSGIIFYIDRPPGSLPPSFPVIRTKSPLLLRKQPASTSLQSEWTSASLSFIQ